MADERLATPEDHPIGLAGALTRLTRERLLVSRQVVVESLACLHETQEAVRRSLMLIQKSDEFLSRFQQCGTPTNGDPGNSAE